MSNLVKISSITKKLVIALLGGFLLLFLAFHMCANLCILRNDGGLWYSQFCHFMGTNIFVKVFEIVLMAVLLFHIICTVVITLQNKKARPVGYQHASKTKTSKGSKLMIWTGIVIFLFLIVHFFNFYFVKIGVTEGIYMAKTEEIQTPQVSTVLQQSAAYGMSPEEFVSANEQQLQMMQGKVDEQTMQQYTDQVAKMREALPVVDFLNNIQPEQLSEDGKWIHKISKEDKRALKEAVPEIEIEPDFYYQARDLFKNVIYVLFYLACFVALWFHMRHAFESAFQTLGLTNYTWYPIISVIGIIYAWVICLGFALVPLYVFFLV